MARHALILAGGSGTRMWPYSTRARPKQLVPLFGGRSLFDLAVERAQAVLSAEQVWLGTGAKLSESLSASGTGIRADRVVVEPEARDTLAAVALGCAVIGAHDPDAVVAVLTADHLIEPVESFAATLRRAFSLAEAHDDALVTMGVEPDHPATGFGYLELGAMVDDDAREVVRFTEKPAREVAEAFVTAGPDRYLWNSGMFAWQARTLLRAVAGFHPGAGETLDVLGRSHGTPQFAELASRRWPTLPKTSVDYGVMEPASVAKEFQVLAVPLAAQWLDVGSWPAYAQALGSDADGNATSGRTVVVGSQGCLVANDDPEHVVAVVGCEGLVVVHTASATLVVPAERAQEVKALQARIAAEAPDLS